VSRHDQSASLRAAARHGLAGLVVLAGLASVVSGAVIGVAGVWASLLGAVVGGGFVLFTVGAVLATARSGPTTTAAVLMGTWLLKLVALLVVLAVLRRFDFYDRPTFGVVVLGVVVGLLAVETRAVLGTRSLHVDAVPSAPEPD